MKNAVSLIDLPICIFSLASEYAAYKQQAAPSRAEVWDGWRFGFIFEGVFYTSQR